MIQGWVQGKSTLLLANYTAPRNPTHFARMLQYPYELSSGLRLGEMKKFGEACIALNKDVGLRAGFITALTA